MALTNEELQQILSGLSPEEQKALFEKLRQTYGDTPTPQPHPKPTSSPSKVYCCIKCGSANYKKNVVTAKGLQRYRCKDCGASFSENYGDSLRYTHLIIDKNTHGSCEVINKCRVQKYYNSSIMRPLLGRESLLNIGSEIVDSLHQYKHFVFGQYESNKYQVWTNNQVAGSGSRFMSDDGSSTVIGLSRIIDTSKGEKSPSGASECIFSSDNRAECESFVSWLNCKFTRFFVAINISKLTGILTDDCFRFVPAPPSDKFDHIYTDQELYKAFNLPQKYIDVIEAVIKERK